MIFRQRFVWRVLLLVLCNQYSSGHKYQFIPDNDDIFSDCPNQPSNVLNVGGLFNFSELTLNVNSGIINCSGNVTTIWNIQQNDRIQFRSDTYHRERAEWVITIYNLLFFDTCKILYDEKQFWGKFWAKYITNANEVKDKCVNVPGTKLIHSPFDLNMTYDLHGVTLTGRYKFVVSIKAFEREKLAYVSK